MTEKHALPDFKPVHAVIYKIWKGLDHGYGFDNDWWQAEDEDIEQFVNRYVEEISKDDHCKIPSIMIIYDLPIPDYTACALIEAGKIAAKLDRKRRAFAKNLSKDNFGQF